jgi:hypothetical protein
MKKAGGSDALNSHQQNLILHLQLSPYPFRIHSKLSTLFLTFTDLLLYVSIVNPCKKLQRIKTQKLQIMLVR